MAHDDKQGINIYPLAFTPHSKAGYKNSHHSGYEHFWKIFTEASKKGMCMHSKHFADTASKIEGYHSTHSWDSGDCRYEQHDFN